MTFEVVSTRSWNVLGTFEDEASMREAVLSSFVSGGAEPDELVVYASSDYGDPQGEVTGLELAELVGFDRSMRAAVPDGETVV